MRGKSKPAAPKRTRAAGNVIAGRRDDQQNISVRTAEQPVTEREIYSGLVLLGVVRELADGSFIAAIGEEVLGPHPTIKAATDALLEVAGPGAAP